MNLSRYSFHCQRAIQQAMRYARSLGHETVEIEHVALAMLRIGHPHFEQNPSLSLLKERLEKFLAMLQRRFGPVETRLSLKLLQVMETLETGRSASEIDVPDFFRALEESSPELQKWSKKFKEDHARSQAFTPMGQSETSAPTAAKNQKKETAKVVAKKSTKTVKQVDEKHRQFLDKYTVDLTAMAERGELDPVLGRDTEVRRVVQVLGRRKKNNPILVGEPGVGKTAIAEAVAIRIAEEKVPESMRGKRLLRLDIGSLLAGAKFRGEFEERMKSLLNAAADLRGQAIFFIDEIHMIIGAGNPEGGADIANLLKPALARGEISTIGATTLDEFKKHIETDPALERRFQAVSVDEPSASVSIAMLRGIKGKYEIHHGVKINDSAITAAVNLSIRYIPSRKLPDKAIDLLDEAATRLRYEIDSQPAEMEELKNKMERLNIEREALSSDSSSQRARVKLDVEFANAKKLYDELHEVWTKHLEACAEMAKLEASKDEYTGLFEQAKSTANYEFAARVQFTEMPSIEKQIESLRTQLSLMQKAHSFLKQEVRDREVAEVIANWTSIPVGKVLEQESNKLRTLHDRISTRVIGQPSAVSSICRSIKRMRAGISSSNRPMGVFLFVGPTGVGKTELAKAVSAEVFSEETKILRFDMSEFMESHQVSRLIGAPPGYVGYGTGGELTEGLKHRPHCLVLLDEVEKAHPRVFDVLLQVFEDGRITDGTGQVVRANNALFIMTSNLAVDASEFGTTQDDEFSMRASLRSFFRPEFINRIDEIVKFKDLGVADYERIIGIQLDQLNVGLLERNLRITLTPRCRYQIVQYGLGANSGGRGIRRAFERTVVDALADRLVDESEFTGSWTLDWIDGYPRWTLEYDPKRYLPAKRDA
jgi:ATP-dependent Clp protease ATP-binding subunit ClpB